MKKIAISSELDTAVSALAVALDERRQLRDIRDRSAEAARNAINAKSAAVRRLGELEADAELEMERQHGRADLEAELHGKSDGKTGYRSAGSKLQKEIEGKRRELAEYDAAIAKAERLAKALPAKMSETDDAVDAANASLQKLMAPFLVAVEAEYRAEISAAAELLIEILARWHVVASSLRLGHVLQHLRDIAIPAIRPGDPAVLFDGFAFKDGLRVGVTEMAAPAVSDSLASLRNVLAELPSATLAIREDRERARIAANELARATAPSVHNSVPGMQPAPPPEPPARFVPTPRNTYRSPGPVAIEANRTANALPHDYSALPGEG